MHLSQATYVDKIDDTHNQVGSKSHIYLVSLHVIKGVFIVVLLSLVLLVLLVYHLPNLLGRESKKI